jgi:pSer/pThr/pTyr-binding forkhead associated (FHA) protein
MQGKDTVELNHKRKIQAAGILKVRAVLLILSGNFLGKSFILDQPSTLIGRDQNCDIQIDDPLISKKHCKILFNEDGHFQIEDMDSKNSTYLNGKILKKPAVMNYGDRIIIGDTILRFFYEEKFETRE